MGLANENAGRPLSVEPEMQVMPSVNTGNWDAVVQQVQWCMAVHTPVNCHCQLEYPIRDTEPVNNIIVCAMVQVTTVG